jgi:uncharacterized protein (UPF0332 family)
VPSPRQSAVYRATVDDVLDPRRFVIAPGPESPEAVEAAATVVEMTLDSWINPEVERRTEAGSWAEGERVRRFQVQFLDESVVVRLNDEVDGYLQVDGGGFVEMNELLSRSEIGDVVDYRLPDEIAHHSHFTAWSHGGAWFTTHQLAFRDPGRHEVLAGGREFLATARDALAERRLRACFDTAYSAAELLARAELLSCAPAIQLALGTSSHKGIGKAYNAWTGHLGNGDARFAAALNRLGELRLTARYGREGLMGDEEEAKTLLAVLTEMEEHVAHLAEAPLHEMPDQFTVIAARNVKPGEVVEASATSIFPVPAD